ncbi:hypothetical protein [Comamonas odontotermitis]|uniref:hypothetical protein n=1 Tax=Comamonas odontotermitis TaxID=379895 RepID=UPI003752D480
MATPQQLLAEGLTDAIGFLAGALAGWGISHLLGWPLFEDGYSAGSIAAIALVGLGGGAGLQLARRWRKSR